MEACGSRRSEPVPVAMSGRLLMESTPINIGGADGEQEGSKCSHFSIRGYVSEIRKRDWKISWPFPIPDEMGDHTNWLPPLNVTEFRWWRCQNCLQTADDTCASGKCGAVVNYSRSQVGTDGICFPEYSVSASHDDAPKLLPCIHQLSERSISEGRRVKEDTCMNVSCGECHQLLCSDEKRKEILAVPSLAEDIQASSNGNGNAKENVTQRTQEKASAITKSEARLAGENIDFKTDNLCHKISSYAKPCFNDRNAPDAVAIKWKGRELISCCKQGCGRGDVANVRLDIKIPTFTTIGGTGFSHKDDLGLSQSNLLRMREQHQEAMEYHGTTKELEIGMQNDGSVTAIEGPSSQLDSMALDKSNCECSRDNQNIGETWDDDASNGHLQRMKSRKVRLLTDIIKSEVSGKSKRNRSSNRAKEAKQTDSAVGQSKSMPNASKDIVLHHSDILENDPKPITGKKQTKKHLAKGKRSSLMSWLKDVAAKVKIHKRHVEKKHSGNATVNSELTLDASAGMALHPGLKSSFATTRVDGTILSGKKRKKKIQVENRHPAMTPSHGGMSQKVKNNTANDETEPIRTTILYSKPEQDAVHGKGLHQGGLKSYVPIHPKANLVKKRNKLPQVEDRQSSLKHQPKDSSRASNKKNVHDSGRHKKALKKQDARRTGKTAEQENLDDIPMDIVELMAKNQHARSLSNAEDATEIRCEMSEETIGIKAGADAMDCAEVIGKEVLGLLHEKTYSMQKPPSNIAGGSMYMTGKIIGRSDRELNGYPPDINRKLSNGHLNLDQVEQSPASGFSAVSQFQENTSSRVPLPVTDSGKKSDNWSLTCMQFLEAHHAKRNILQDDTGGPAYCSGPDGSGSLGPTKVMPFDINITPEADELYDAEAMFSHGPEPMSGRNKNASSHGYCVLKSMNTNPASNLQKQKGKTLIDVNKGTVPAHTFSCTEKENEYHTKFMANTDLYTNDTISAMHLLRLMDQGACSSTSGDIPMDGKQDDLLKQPRFPHNHYHNFLGLEDGIFNTIESSILPTPSELIDHNRQQGNSSKLLPPPVKTGAFGSSILNTTHDPSEHVRPFGFVGGFTGKTISPPPKPRGREKTKGTKAPKQPRGRPRSHGSALQDGNFGKSRESVAVHSKKRLLSTPESKNSLMKRPLMTHVEVLGNKKGETALAVKSSSVTEICSLNRNPAEFSIIGTDNVYMIGSEDLKPMKIIPPKEGMRLTNPDGHKRRRMMKLTAIQGH